MRPIPRRHAKPKAIFALAAIFFLMLLSLNFFDSGLLWDENAYLGNARAVIGHSNFTESFRFPLLQLMLGSVWFLTGESVLAAKVMVMLFSVASAYIFYLIAKRQFREAHALMATAAFSFSHLILYWGFRVYTDMPAMFFVVASFYLFTSGNRTRNVVAAGVLASMAFLMRFPYGIFFVSIILYLSVQKSYRKIAIALMSTLFVLVPWVSYNYAIHNGDIIYDLREQFSIVYTYTAPESPLAHAVNAAIEMNIMAVFMVFGLYMLIKDRSGYRNLILIYLLLYFAYFLFLTNLKIPRYLIGSLPFLYLISMDGLVKVSGLRKQWPSRLPVLIAVSITIAISLSYTYSQLSYVSGCNNSGPLKPSVAYICNSGAKSVVSNFWPYFGYACNDKVAAIWSTNIDELINLEKPEYFIYSPQFGDPANKTAMDNHPRLALEKEFTGGCNEKVFIYKVRS